jgi:hypothetical protein
VRLPNAGKARCNNIEGTVLYGLSIISHIVLPPPSALSWHFCHNLCFQFVSLMKYNSPYYSSPERYQSRQCSLLSLVSLCRSVPKYNRRLLYRTDYRVHERAISHTAHIHSPALGVRYNLRPSVSGLGLGSALIHQRGRAFSPTLYPPHPTISPSFLYSKLTPLLNPAFLPYSRYG